MKPRPMRQYRLRYQHLKKKKKKKKLGFRHRRPCSPIPRRSGRSAGSAVSFSIFRRMRLINVSTLRSLTDESSLSRRAESSASRLKTMPGVRGEQMQQIELAPRELDPDRRCSTRAAPDRSQRAHSATTRPVATRRRSLGEPRAPDQRADAGDQFADAERLRQIVVGAGLQTEHLVGLFAPRRQQQHRHVGVGGSRRIALQSVRPSRPGSIRSRTTRSTGLGRKRSEHPRHRRRRGVAAFEAEVQLDQLADVRLVLDEQHAPRRFARARAPPRPLVCRLIQVSLAAAWFWPAIVFSHLCHGRATGLPSKESDWRLRHPQLRVTIAEDNHADTNDKASHGCVSSSLSDRRHALARPGDGGGRRGGPGSARLPPRGPALGPRARAPAARARTDRRAARAGERPSFRSHKDEFQAIGERMKTARPAQGRGHRNACRWRGRSPRAPDSLAAVEADAAVLRAKVHAAVFQVLTPEQQEKAKTLKAEREKRRSRARTDPAAPGGSRTAGGRLQRSRRSGHRAAGGPASFN